MFRCLRNDQTDILNYFNSQELNKNTLKHLNVCPWNRNTNIYIKKKNNNNNN